MSRIWIKQAPLCLALTLFALPAMADNIFSGVINFGREILDETRKLAPGIQNDRRHEQAADVQAVLNDGRDSPAVEYSDSNIATAQPSTRQHTSHVVVQPPINGQPTGSNLNYTYGESQRSATPKAQQNNDASFKQPSAPSPSTSSGNFGWQEENNLQ